jgi:3-phenylpropionate/cinnamic acid dioxygenase small subunit
MEMAGVEKAEELVVGSGSPSSNGLASRLVTLNAAYVRAIDNERFEEWPDFFLDPCLYKVTTAENVARGHEAGLIFADSRGMLQDRVTALRQVSVYEHQRYRHIIGLPTILGEEDGAIRAETPFLVVRILRTGEMDIFATGRYEDLIAADGEVLRFRQRIAVCDSARIDTLLALPL